MESESKIKSKNGKNKKLANLFTNNDNNSTENIIRFVPLEILKNTKKKYNKKIQYNTNKQIFKNFSESSFSSISNDSLDSLDVEFHSDEDIKLKPIPKNPILDKYNQDENISIEDTIYLPKFTKRIQNKVSNLFNNSK
jgi:TRAP-type uncharacterized transport system substrate-binding protein